MSVSTLVRVQFIVFASFEAAIKAGYPSAEWGTWQTQPGSTEMSEGWIALDYED